MDPVELVLELLYYRTEVALESGTDVQSAGVALAVDRIGAGLQRHIGHVGESHGRAGWCVDAQTPDVEDAGARLRCAPYNDVVGLTAAEDVTHLLTGDQGCSGSAYIAWLQSVPFSLGKIHLDLQLRDVCRHIGVLILDAFDAAHDLFDLGGFFAQDRQVLAKDAHDDRLLAAGDHFLDALIEVGLGLPEKAGIGIVDIFYLIESLVVIRRWIDADPVLAEIDPCDLLAKERLAHMCSEIAYARNLPELLTNR